jgi:hypothetical protein
LQLTIRSAQVGNALQEMYRNLFKSQKVQRVQIFRVYSPYLKSLFLPLKNPFASCQMEVLLLDSKTEDFPMDKLTLRSFSGSEMDLDTVSLLFPESDRQLKTQEHKCLLSNLTSSQLSLPFIARLMTLRKY